jgi:hypothetical protein
MDALVGLLFSLFLFVVFLVIGLLAFWVVAEILTLTFDMWVNK